MPVSDHAHIVAKWQKCENLLKVCSLNCTLDLEASQFQITKTYKDKTNGDYEVNLENIDTVREVECFLLGYSNNLG